MSSKPGSKIPLPLLSRLKDPITNKVDALNLWLKPSSKPVEIDIRQFGDYEHFFYSFEQYPDLHIPNLVKVSWKPVEKYLQPLEGPPEEEDRFIDFVAGRISSGESVPPILTDKGALFDGRHRAWAAHALGLKKVPVVEIGQYWSR